MSKRPNADGPTPVRSKYAPKRTPAQIAEDRTEMMRLIRRGMTQAQVAERLGISRPRVTQEYALVLKQLAEKRTTDAAQLVARHLERLSEVREEAWAEWERSKQATAKEEREERPTTGGTGRKAGLKRGTTSPQALALRLQHVKRTTTGRLGDPRFLEIVLDTYREEARLLALYPPTPTLNVNNQVAIGWDALFARDEVRVNQIEVELLEARGVSREDAEAVLRGEAELEEEP